MNKFSDCFRHSISTADDAEKIKAMEDKLDHLLTAFPGITHTGTSVSSAVITFTLTGPATEIVNYTTNRCGRVFDATFDCNGTVVRQSGANLLVEIPRKDTLNLLYGDIADSLTIDKSYLKTFVGIKSDNNATPVIIDFQKTQHILLGGATGSGKSVCLDQMLLTMLNHYSPDELRLILCDGKAGATLNKYKGLPHTDAIATDNVSMIALLEDTLKKMMDQYSTIIAAGYENISDYNQYSGNAKLPYHLVIVEEINVMMDMAGGMDAKAVATKLKALLTSIGVTGRAAGYHMIITTQQPNAKVLTTEFRGCFSGRICFRVADKKESRMIFDSPVAAQIKRQGEGYWNGSEDGVPERMRTALVTFPETRAAIQYIIDKYKTTP